MITDVYNWFRGWTACSPTTEIIDFRSRATPACENPFNKQKIACVLATAASRLDLEGEEGCAASRTAAHAVVAGRLPSSGQIGRRGGSRTGVVAAARA